MTQDHRFKPGDRVRVNVGGHPDNPWNGVYATVVGWSSDMVVMHPDTRPTGASVNPTGNVCAPPASLIPVVTATQLIETIRNAGIRI